MPPDPRTSLPPAVAGRDAAIAAAVETWFRHHARELPWRRVVAVVDGTPRRDPYHALVSELMCQQTQVSRVIDRFNAFIQRFPTVFDLARAHENDVLALWSGLGYYRRARLLHAASRYVVDQLNAEFPTDADELRRLPGVGRYTAGAISSMALGQRTPLVDGNVSRVLLRVEGITAAFARTGDKQAENWAWKRSAELVATATTPGAFNEGMMELGALICTPVTPDCPACPLVSHCQAYAAGIQDTIPAPREAGARKKLFCASLIVRDQDGRIAIEQRGPRGMWAGLWQAPTIERDGKKFTAAEVRARFVGDADIAEPNKYPLSRVDAFLHQTTHREVHFEVWEWSSSAFPHQLWTWIAHDKIGTLGMSSAQQRILMRSVSTRAARSPKRRE